MKEIYLDGNDIRALSNRFISSIRHAKEITAMSNHPSVDVVMNDLSEGIKINLDILLKVIEDGADNYEMKLVITEKENKKLILNSSTCTRTDSST